MNKRDYYEILGLSKNATTEEIKKAYKKKAKATHPDRGGDETLFKEINEANEVLSDPDKRAKYDQFGHNTPRGGQPMGADVFAEFFRRATSGFTQRQVKGSDLYLTIKLTLEEIFTGVNKTIKYKRNTTCATCSGKGGTGIKVCTGCSGSGVISETFATQFGTHVQTKVCDVCNGQAEIIETECTTCNGTGLNITEETVNIDIPSGVADNMGMNMNGMGQHIKNGIAGDLIITIMELPHNVFVRNGNDLKYALKLTYPQLILGDKVEIKTIEGTKIRIEVQEYTKTGAILRIPSKGMKQLQSESRGDLLLHVELLVPSIVSDEEKELIKSLKILNEKVATETTK